MTEQSDEERITAIVSVLESTSAYGCHVESTEVEWLIERLHATEAERDDWKHRTEVSARMRIQIESSLAARDAVISAIDERLNQPTRPYGDPSFAMISERASIRELYGPEVVDDIDRILSAAPVSVLRERDAEVWWEGATAQWEHRPIGNRVLESENPHRAGADHDG